MLRRLERGLREPFQPGDQVVFIDGYDLPDGGSLPAGAVADVVRELDGGDRLLVEVLAFDSNANALSVVRTGVLLEVDRGRVRRNRLFSA